MHGFYRIVTTINLILVGPCAVNLTEHTILWDSGIKNGPNLHMIDPLFPGKTTLDKQYYQESLPSSLSRQHETRTFPAHTGKDEGVEWKKEWFSELDETFTLLLLFRGRFDLCRHWTVHAELTLWSRVMGNGVRWHKDLAWCSFKSDMVTKWLWLSIH